MARSVLSCHMHAIMRQAQEACSEVQAFHVVECGCMCQATMAWCQCDKPPAVQHIANKTWQVSENSQLNP
jgi:hypothetical protein